MILGKISAQSVAVVAINLDKFTGKIAGKSPCKLFSELQEELHELMSDRAVGDICWGLWEWGYLRGRGWERGEEAGVRPSLETSKK